MPVPFRENSNGIFSAPFFSEDELQLEGHGQQ